MFRPPVYGPDPDAHIGPVHGPDQEFFTDRVNREVAEIVAAHQYGYGGPCGGCTCGWIDDVPETHPWYDMSFIDHLISVLREIEA